MNGKIHSITSKQLMVFIVSSQIGFGILTLPSTLAGVVGHNGWICTSLTGLAGMPMVFIIMLLLKRYSDKSIFQINMLLYGKILGTLLNINIIAYTCFTSSIGSRLFSEFIKIVVLRRTPLIAISLFLLIPTAYICYAGLKVLSRFSGMLFFDYILVIIFFIFTYRHISITFILPIGSTEVSAIFKGMQKTALSFLGFELVTIIYRNIKDKENSIKYALGAMSFTTFFFAFVVLMVTLLCGEEKLKFLMFPLYNVYTSMRMPIFERTDLLFILFWFPVMGHAIRAYYFCFYYSITKTFNMEKSKLVLLIVCIIELIMGRIPKGFNGVLKYAGYIGIWGEIVIGLLIFSYVFSFINKKGVITK